MTIRPMLDDLGAEYLRSILDYEPSTGAFRWRPRDDISAGLNTRLAGTPAGTLGPHGYVCIGIRGRPYRAHRLAWLYAYGRWPEAYIDHINGVTDDNRIENLREASFRQNNWNTRTSIANTSGFKGVNWHRGKNKWVARIRINGRLVQLCASKDFDVAKAARIAAVKKHHGEFARIE